MQIYKKKLVYKKKPKYIIEKKINFENISNEYKENIFLLTRMAFKIFGNLIIDYVHAGNILVKK
tara:strand:+ start:1124 stop:1315 length:192 start_codon:yes stop_codon:yes gene_type:complete